MGNEKKITYTEPMDFFPEELRKKYKLGEYAEDEDESEPVEDEKDNG